MSPDVNELVHQLYTASRNYRHQKTADTLKEVIRLAQQLEDLGYTMVWKPHDNCIGVHRTGASYG